MSDILHVCVPARDYTINYKSMLTLNDTAYFMHKTGVAWHFWGGHWLTYARHRAISDAYRYELQMTGTDPLQIRGLLLDSDIQIDTDPKELARILTLADANDLNITANYQMSNGKNQIFKSATERYTDPELRALYDACDFELLRYDIGSLGFYYGHLPKAYHFHMDDMKDEAIYFFSDNAYLHVRLATKIKLSKKNVWQRSTWHDYDHDTDKPIDFKDL